MSKLKDKWALVTGASSGLGVDFATILAEQGCNVVLVARREDRLKTLASELESKHGIKARVITSDLGRRESARELYNKIKAEKLEIDVLINNAGFGVHGDFMDTPWERTEQMLQLDLMTLTDLTRLFTADMQARKFGYVLLISSIAAYQPTPTYAVYAAIKAYVLHFGEALSWELRKSGVGVTVLSPGATATEFMDVAGQPDTLLLKLTIMKSRKCAEIGIKAMLKKRQSVVPGILNKMAALGIRGVPRFLQPAISGGAVN